MSDTCQGPGWWQASDDQWYPPESHPNYRPPPPVPQGVPSIEAVGGTEGQPKGPTHPPHKEGWWGEHGFPFSLRPLPIVTGIVVALMAIGGIAFATSGSGGAPSAAPPDTTTAATDPPTTTTVPPTTTTTVPPTTTTTVPPGITKTDTEPDGWSYKFNFVYNKTDPSPSPSGCYGTPPPGKTNAWFTMTITNLISDRAAPPPAINIEANLNSDGTAVVPNALQDWTNSPTNIFYTKIEVTPGQPNTPCVLDYNPGGQIPAGQSATYTVFVGSVQSPPPPGFALLVAIYSGGSTQHFSVPGQG
jgi:hypothetical protein